MNNAFVDQIAHARVIIAALSPTSDSGQPFTLSPGDLATAQEPQPHRRTFNVRVDAAPPETLGWIGTSHRTIEARFRVELNYDALRDLNDLDAYIVEDTDAIVSALELPSGRVSADVLIIQLVDRQVAQTSDFAAMVLIFSIQYRVAVP